MREITQKAKTAMTKPNTPEKSYLCIYAWILCSTLTIFGEQFVRAEEPLPSKPIFELIKGHGIDVCEAYLKRLNATEFLDNNPVKGRITEPLLGGFIDLKPVPLTAEEIQRINYKTISFDRYQDQDLIEKYFKKWGEMEANFQNPIPKSERILIDHFRKSILEIINNNISSKQKTQFIRYQDQLDLDNDGVADDAVIRINQGIYIIDQSTHKINEDKMKQIFADQEALEWPSLISFPKSAFPISIFSYKGKYYFDGFFNNLRFFNGFGYSLNRLPTEPYYIGVFMHEKYQSNRVCEYQWMNPPLVNGMLNY